jgi:hypothetical protein
MGATRPDAPGAMTTGYPPARLATSIRTGVLDAAGTLMTTTAEW